jgi:hypothetical protein
VFVLFNTKRIDLASVLTVWVIGLSLWLCGCGDTTPPLYATLTFKRDGSHFAGTVLRRDSKTITVTSPTGDTHTYLYDELADIKYGAPENPANVSVPGSGSPSAGKSASGLAAPAGGVATGDSVIQFPVGSAFPVRTRGFLDSCCVPVGALSLGVLDADVKLGGKVAIPAGTNVTMELVDTKTVDGRTSMIFQLGSADFGNRHYLFTTAKGGLEPGAVVTFTGAKDGSQEAKAHGLTVHLDDQSFMAFKAASPVILKASQ